MHRDDLESVLALDYHFDTLNSSQSLNGNGDGELTETLHHLRALADRPVPDPAFIRRLRADLGRVEMAGGADAAPPVLTVVPVADVTAPGVDHSVSSSRGVPAFPRWGWPRIEIAAAVLVLAVLAGYLATAEQGRRVAQVGGITVPAQELASPPVELRIEAIGVEAPIEVRVGAENEPALIPAASDPWVVAWRAESAMPGEGGNVVLEGHLDDWNTGPAVFWDLRELVSGDRIEVTGVNGTTFSYVVEWSRPYPLASATAEDEEAVLGPTAADSLTLITAAGEYDMSTGYYPEVLVVRARLDDVSSSPAEGVTPVPALTDDEPVLLWIDAIDAYAPVVRRKGDADPTLAPQSLDPLAAFWRDDSARLGEVGNVVIEGRHNQQWTRDAIFAGLKDLKPGDRIDVVSRGLEAFTYEVEWLRTYSRADPTDAQVREILGRTPEASLTLITTTDELDREAGWYRDVLVVRSRFVSSAPFPVLAEPDASECHGAPRTIAEFEAATDALLADAEEVREIVRPTSPLAATEEPVATDITDAIFATERGIVACMNANDTLRIYAFFTDDGLLRSFKQMYQDLLDLTWEFEPDYSQFATPAPPLAVDDRHALLAIDDVRMLDDGRVAATVTIGPGGGGVIGMPTGGIPVTHIFAREGDRYLIDEFVVPERGS